ncbi:MAG: TldD/PmbA family protein [Myxococcales bacterium]|nr:TldD/PmbA family protein [Myxococcales bacterium]
MSVRDELLTLANDVMKRARELGADEVSVAVSRGSHVTIQRRDRKVERATEAINQGLVVSLLANERFTSNSTSDLRPEALDDFLRRCVESASFLEPDPYRALPDAELCGRGVSEEQLDQDDPAWRERTDGDRNAQAEAIEEAVLASAREDQVSCASYVADGRGEAVKVMSNGFSDHTAGAWFSAGAEVTLSEGDKRPEAAAYYAARHLSDMPSAERIASDAQERVRQRLASRPAPSATYPMFLENRAVGRLLGVMAAPLSGSALHQGRSCMADKLGEAIASTALTIVDDPTIPRGLGSRPWDGDALVARPRVMVKEGVLESYNIGVYYARKLGVEPKGSGRSNWIVEPGTRTLQQMAADIDKAVLVTGFIGGNSNPSTGDFSFGIRGLLLERGEVVQSLSEMNVSGNILSLMPRLREVGSDVWSWSATRCGTLLFDDVQFSGT